MQIKLKDGTAFDLPDESTAADLAQKLGLTSPFQALAANVNGKTVDLTTP
ncbi:MAG: TGS domain-containing protein, partial [Chlamydiia bacterium]|nr:TGS domain-containing protein [Chlamydiia bacterium]